MAKKTVQSLSNGFMSVFAVVTVVGTVFFGAHWIFSQGAETPSFTNPQLETLETQEPKNSEFIVAGWLPDWSGEAGVQSLRQNGQYLTNISPVWYEVTAQGTINDKRPTNYEEIIRIAQTHNLEITPSIALFDHEHLTAAFASPESLQLHIEQVIAAGTQPGVHGIDIDYESTKLTDKDGYFAFLQGVKTAFEASGHKLVVTVLPKWERLGPYLSLRETREVQDWATINEIADEIRVMTYDYTWQNSPFPGPIAPLEWVERVIQYGIQRVPPEKLVLGIHLYAYEKYAERETPEQMGNFEDPLLQWYPDAELNQGEGRIGRAYTYSTVQRVIQEYEGTLDEYEGEKIFRYSKINDDTGVYEDRVLTFIDRDGVQARIHLAKKYNLGGVSYWRLGGEEDSISLDSKNL